MKKAILSSFCALLVAPSAFAGATNIQLSCVSDSGRTKLEASVPGDFAEHDVAFSIDGKSVRYFDTVNQTTGQSESNSAIVMDGTMRARNFKFAVFVDEGNKFDAQVLKFEALPNTIKLSRNSNGERGSLRAQVQGRDPRNTAEESKLIEVKCSYVYEI